MGVRFLLFGRRKSPFFFPSECLFHREACNSFLQRNPPAIASPLLFFLSFHGVSSSPFFPSPPPRRHQPFPPPPQPTGAHPPLSLSPRQGTISFSREMERRSPFPPLPPPILSFPSIEEVAWRKTVLFPFFRNPFFPEAQRLALSLFFPLSSYFSGKTIPSLFPP